MQLHVVLLYKTHEHFNLAKGHNCTQSTLINLRFHLAKRDNSFYTVNTSVGTECNHVKSQTGVVTK